MRVAIFYYSRTGNTEEVAHVLAWDLAGRGIDVGLFRVRPVREYSGPLHLNPRLMYDTLVRRGTRIRIEPYEPDIRGYRVVVVASPVWCETLAAPVQELLRRCHGVGVPIVLVTTSYMKTGYRRLRGVVERLTGRRPLYHVNIPAGAVRDREVLSQVIRGVVEGVLEAARGT